jgi:hypothetical protein
MSDSIERRLCLLEERLSDLVACVEEYFVSRRAEEGLVGRLSEVGDADREREESVAELEEETSSVFTDELRRREGMSSPRYWWKEGEAGVYVQLGDIWVRDNGDASIVEVSKLPDDAIEVTDPMFWSDAGVPERVENT